MSLQPPKINFYNTARARLFLLVLLVVIPALGVQVFGAWSDLQQTLNERKLESVRVIDHAQSDFDHLLIETRTVFTDLVRLNDIRSSNNCTQVFTALRFAYERLAPDAVNLALADAQGNIYCAINPVQGDRNIASQSDFQAALQTLDLSAGVYRLNPSTGLPFVSVSYPALSLDGKVQTIIIATFETHWLEIWQSETLLPAGASVTLLTTDGTALWRTVSREKMPVNGLTISKSDWFGPLQAGKDVVEGPDFDGVIRLHTITPLGNSAILHLGYPVSELYAQTYDNLRWKLALLGLVVVFAFGIAWWVSATMFLHPLDNLLGVVKRVQDGDLSARVSGLHGLGELTALAYSFDKMTDALQQREAERQQSEGRFRAMFENAAVGISIISPDGRTLAVNPMLVKLSGRPEAQLIELGGRSVTYPEDQNIGMAEFREILEGKRDSYQVEKRYVHEDGRIHWMKQSVSAVRDSAGKALYMIVIAEDIEERKRALEELQESEARFRAMFDNAAVGVAVMTLDRHIVQINQTATRLTGYTEEEIRQINPSMLAIEEDRLIDRDLFPELVEGKRDQYTVEKRYIRKNGNVFWGRVNFSSVRGVNGKPHYIIGLIEDITEEKRAAERLAIQEAEHRRQLEQRIAERTEELNLANERLREKAAQDAVTAERTRLARDLHDAVTQTLFSTTLIADVLPDIWEMNPDEGKRRLEELRLLTRGALAEMRTLLVELRPNALVEVPLPTLLRQLTESLSGRARINIQLSTEGERKLPADVQVSLYRIAQEALNNVFKHAKASEAFVTLRMGDAVRLTVADNGAGFDPSTITADHLGVKIMRERADAISAKLSIYSEPGEGTQISVVWL